MTATRTDDAANAGESTPRPRVRQRQLWIPIALALTVVFATVTVAWVVSPSPGSDSFLSPKAKDGQGSSKLADSLADNGVSVDRHTDAEEAFDAAAVNDTTLFLPAPDYLNGNELRDLQTLAGNEHTRIVFVDPSREFLLSMGLQNDGAARIAPKLVEPAGNNEECSLPEATSAGKANMRRQAYTVSDSSASLTPTLKWNFCYDNGLAHATNGDASAVVAGAAEPFTDEYFDQAGNAELTTKLLGQTDTVVWLDKHSLTTVPDPTPQSSQPPDRTPTHPDRDRIQYPDEASTNPIYDALPSWMWAALVGTVLLGLLAALWKGRRLGPPVTEPLPVTVPSAETVHGRARLYRRARAYTATIRALRAGALERIRPRLGLSSQAIQTEVTQAVVNRTGWPSEQVTATLYSTQPSNEAELFDAARAVDALVSAVEQASPSGD